MEKIIYLLCLVISSSMFTNCDKENDDITKEVIGTYVGLYSSNATGDIDDYEIEIVKVNDSRIRIEAVTGSEFESWETDLERINSSNISAPVGQVDPSVMFVIGSETAVVFQRGAEQDAYNGQLR